MLTADDIFGGLASEPIEVQPPGATKTVRLRYPTFAEWYELVTAQRSLDGKDPPADLIAKTIAVCVAGSDGARRMTDAEATIFLTSSAKTVIWLYKKCWETVLRDDDESVGEDAKK